MSADTNQKPPFDLKAVQTSMAFTSPPPALLPTLRAIWDEAVDQLKRAEEKPRTRLKKIWGKTPPPVGEFSALERAAFAKHLGLLDSLPKDLIAYAYFNTLKIIHGINDAFYDIHPLTTPLGDEKADEALMKRLCARDNLKEEAFLNHVVTPFFALQLNAAFLRTHLDVPKGVSLSPAVLHDRASKGGQGAKRGMEAVQEVVIQCLEAASNGQIDKSPTALGHANVARIKAALEQHMSDLRRRQQRGEDVSMNYALSISAEGVVQKLSRWAKENTQFRERLAKLCKLKA
ncbi:MULTISPECIES: hypothetical protein [Acidovorax]|uniref:Uncharacterized protein n=1 Tax=Acidovorax facilis TaxID=12917 RepID=A0ABV8DIH7_9BURK|nr:MULTISPECIES: hypothetical protein [Acidovorax]MBO1010313.1 hypothetical protein [Acidovorax sp. SD340]MCO4245434.1 hypothetical protein [Acidovorax facilis]